MQNENQIIWKQKGYVLFLEEMNHSPKDILVQISIHALMHFINLFLIFVGDTGEKKKAVLCTSKEVIIAQDNDSQVQFSATEQTETNQSICLRLIVSFNN